jgi:hypothetical protein
MRSRHPWPVTPLARSVGIAFALAAPLAAWSQAALVHPMGRAMIVTPDSAAGRVVRTVFQRTYDRVRIEQSEPGAPAAYAHPVASVGTEQLRAALAALRRTDSRNAELFNDDELASIVPPLVQALAEVTPQQEVTFAVAGRHGALGPLVERSVTTGRMFHSADGLELIVGLAHRPFEGQFLATGLLIAFEPGRRAAPVDPNLRLAPQGTLGQRRSDWVTLAVGPAAMAAPPAVPAPAAAAPAAPAAAPAAPAAVAAPLAPAAPPAAAQAQPGTRTPAFLAEQEERLKTLKRLRDQNLITEDEYQQKRREILQLL